MDRMGSWVRDVNVCLATEAAEDKYDVHICVWHGLLAGDC